ncbi:MAG TPA: hypothetical protein VFW96_26105 [Thermomicrobiales bacterium]|nr:hypothetical protein [Thermomicrobiales bacterium]
MTMPHEMERTEAAPPHYAAELAALRARLREVEAALGLPLRPGQPVQPDVPALRRRVAALERRAGIVPGLVPLPGCDEVAPARATVITSQPEGRRPAWWERGRAALAAVAVVAALAWLLHPLPGGPGYFRAAEPTAQAAAGALATSSVPAEDQPARADYRAPRGAGACRAGDIACLPDEDIIGGDMPQAPAAAPGRPPCPTGGSASCGPPAPGDDATGGDTPFCAGNEVVIANQCVIP